MNVFLNFYFYGNICRGDQKVEKVGFRGRNYWSSFIFVLYSLFKIYLVF